MSHMKKKKNETQHNHMHISHIFIYQNPNAPIHTICQHKSIWPLTNVIPRWIVVTSHEHIPTVTNNPCTTDPSRILPHNLRVMPALFPKRARIGGVRVVLLFVSPRPNSVRRGPIRAATPKYVLPKLEPEFRERMDQRAIRLPLSSPPLCVILEIEVPN